jgi:hypothetical protein
MPAVPQKGLVIRGNFVCPETPVPKELLLFFDSAARRMHSGLRSLEVDMATGISKARPRRDYPMLRRFSVSILEEGGRLGLKCLLLSYFRVGDNSPATLSICASHPKSSIEDVLWQVRLQTHTSADGQIVRYSVGKRHSPSSRGTRGSALRSRTYSRHDRICKSSSDRREAGIGTSDSE